MQGTGRLFLVRRSQELDADWVMGMAAQNAG
jgi:hypothetical protein